MEVEAARVWKPKEGPQRRFMECGALEACMGGIVGGGKTMALLLNPLRHVHRPGFAGVIFRRNYTELVKADGLIERAANIYRAVGAEGREGGKNWVWPSGARIDLAAMDHENDRFAYDGAAFQYIAFDELQTFSKIQFTYLYSRLRQNAATSSAPIPLRTRASATPGGLHHEWVLERYSPWIRATDPLWKGYRARDGERLHYRYDEQKKEQVICGPDDEDARSRAYFATAMLDEVGTDYRRGLDELDDLTRAQRKFGDWLIRPGSGIFFKSTSFVIVDAAPLRVRARVRGWDLAATPKDPNAAEGKTAATCGVLMALDHRGDVYIEDVKRAWIDPDEVEQLILDTIIEDDEEYGAHAVLADLPQDPGQAGKHQKRAFGRTFEGRWFRMTPEQGDKVNRIKPLSAHASKENGRPIRLVRGDWNEAYMKELISFPYGLKDQGDASSRAYASCLRMPPLVASVHGEGQKQQRETARGFGGY